jgi:predicted transcriptional regulator
MTLITVKDFSNETGILTCTLYKMIESRGIDYVEKIAGVKKPFQLYDKSTLESMVQSRQKKGRRRKPKQLEINALKIW